MNNLDSALVERLRELLAKATEQPWDYAARLPNVEIASVGHIGDYCIGVRTPGIPNGNYRDTSFGRDVDDAALIVAAVNALPALLDELYALRTRLAGGGDDSAVFGRMVRALLADARREEWSNDHFVRQVIKAEDDALIAALTRPPSEAAAVDDPVRAAGQRLSNIAFNLAQCKHLPADDTDMLDLARKDWDAALASQQAVKP